MTTKVKRYCLVCVLCAGAGLLAGCSGQTVKNAGIGTAVVALADSGSLISPETLAAGAVIYVLYDPAAPNWEIEVEEIEQDVVFRLNLRHKALHTGGDGEARQVFQRNARRLARENDMPDFEILAYEEGVASTRPFAQRFAMGEIRLVRSRAFPGY